MSLEGQIALDRIIKWIIKGLILITLIDISKISQTWSEETEDLDYVSLADRIVKCRYTNFEEKCWFPHLIRPTPLPAATVHSMLGVSTVVVDAVVGKSTSLPCDVEPDSKEDRVYMVLWFRHTGGKPLYSFDVRGRPYIKALHWSDPLAFGRRAYFVTIARPASLTIEIVQLDDEGIYRCRVDFKNSPTRNFQIKLNVIVPPHQMLLYDEAGRDMAGVIGPLEEGANFTLLCELRGGRPQPTLRWLMNNTVIEKHTVLKNDGKVIVSKISMTGADRTWLNSSIRCQANNTHLLSPHERSARIEMNLRPESVRITNKPLEMSADRHVTLVCVSHGSHPQAQITWYRDNRRFIKGKIEEFTNDTTTVSRLVIVPQPEDDGVVIKCRAENTLLSVALEDYFRMTVVYKPVVSVTLGRNLNAQEIKEGDDVYFECNIKANPKQYRIDWYHHKQDKHVKVKSNLTKITNEVFRGTYFSGQSLIIKMITKNDGGLYSCRVANDMGEVTSSELYLRVLYAPLCTQDNVVTVGVSLDKTVKVRCTVSAEPADVTFTWQFNHSSDSFQVSPARYGEYGPSFLVASGGTASELRYNAASERDYGTLSCRGRNAIGEQKKPCVFNVIPAARPDPPRNCSATKIPRHSEPYLAVHCYAGYDGGLKQHFILEITGEPTEVLVNTTVNQPGFYDPSQNVDVWMNVTWSMLENIEADQALAVIASNSKGSADPVILQGLVFKTSDKIKEGATAGSMQIHVVAALVAVATLLAVGAVLAAIALKKRPETTTTVTSKRPSQSVIQVDSQGRRYLIAYPATSEKETKPDILNPKPDNAPPRVVLESDDGETFTLRELRPGRSNQPPQPSDAVVRHARINN